MEKEKAGDPNPLEKWQNEHAYDDLVAVAKLGISLKRFLELKGMGVVWDEAEGKKLAEGTDIADIAHQLHKWAVRQVLKKPRPRVIGPNQ